MTAAAVPYLVAVGVVAFITGVVVTVSAGQLIRDRRRAAQARRRESAGLTRRRTDREP